MTGEHRDTYALILAAIDRGDLAPGQRLVEADLADRLGMSRTPVREALQRLEAHGVVVREGRSLSVATLDHDQQGELYEVRSHVEGLAAKLAARHAAPWSRKISATSSDLRGIAGYEGPAFFLRLPGVPRSSNGLPVSAIMPVATRTYPAVVVSLACPSNAWITRMSSPRSRRWVAKLCLSVCGTARLWMCERRSARRKAD